MTGNFEAKHPRAKDGKFTEKLREESGIELLVENPSPRQIPPRIASVGRYLSGK